MMLRLKEDFKHLKQRHITNVMVVGGADAARIAALEKRVEELAEKIAYKLGI